MGQITTLILQIWLPEDGVALQREPMRVSALPCFPLELRMVCMDLWGRDGHATCLCWVTVTLRTSSGFPLRGGLVLIIQELSAGAGVQQASALRLVCRCGERVCDA